jgi:hypothetical protein
MNNLIPRACGTKARSAQRTNPLVSLHLLNLAPLPETLLLFQEFFHPFCGRGFQWRG